VGGRGPPAVGAVPLPGVVAEVTDGAVVLRLGGAEPRLRRRPRLAGGLRGAATDRRWRPDAAPAVARALGLSRLRHGPAAPGAERGFRSRQGLPADARLGRAGGRRRRPPPRARRRGSRRTALRTSARSDASSPGGRCASTCRCSRRRPAGARRRLRPALAVRSLRAEARADGVAFGYEVFALGHPTRLVLDLWPDRDGIPAAVETRRGARPGRGLPQLPHRGQRRTRPASTSWRWRPKRASGASWVPRARPGRRWRWADGAFAAINGGYFDPGSRTAIGLLVVDGNWLSPPSRGRAAVGFGPDGVIIDRVRTRTGVWIDDRLVLASAHALADRARSIASAGTARPERRARGAAARCRRRRGRQPRRTGAGAQGGRVVVYPPELRALALADEGALVRTATVV
jgi:hypothetical protein